MHAVGANSAQLVMPGVKLMKQTAAVLIVSVGLLSLACSGEIREGARAPADFAGALQWCSSVTILVRSLASPTRRLKWDR
jgi:hypothetical protein